MTTEKFTKQHLDFFTAEDGAYSVITATERGDGQITVAGHEKKIVLDFFGQDNIHRQNVPEDHIDPKKEFVFYNTGKNIKLSLDYPKARGQELRLYISAPFVGAANDIWFVFRKKGSKFLHLGSMSQQKWADINNGASIGNNGLDIAKKFGRKVFVEMSLEGRLNDDKWDFAKAVWAPAKKKGGQNWPYWSSILDIQRGDIMLHLHGKQPNAKFVGFSICSSNGYETTERPAKPREWGFAKNYFRADLSDFTPLDVPLSLTELFKDKKKELTAYFRNNKSLKTSRKKLFFVEKKRGLECQNGGYLTEADNELLQIIFDTPLDQEKAQKNRGIRKTVNTDTKLTVTASRIGQKIFSDEIKDLYKDSCCFPGCKVNDRRFLIGAHIARWSDNPDLRGNLANGLCLCVFHDKAFETGMFTLDEKFRVVLNSAESKSGCFALMQDGNKRQINLTEIKPLEIALVEHRKRVKIKI